MHRYLLKPLYPFLLAVYFVLLVYSRNLGEAFIEQTFRSVAIAVVMTLVLFLAFTRIVADRNKAAFITGWILIFLIALPVQETIQSSFVPKNPILALAISAALFGAVVLVLLKLLANWQLVTQALNVAAGTLLLIVVAQIANYGMQDNSVITEPKLFENLVTTEEFTAPDEPLPNIYYILTDAYARGDVLEELYNFDNSPFLDFLEDSGFRIATNSYSNYNYTRYVIPTVLNYNYVADETSFPENTHGGAVTNSLRQLTFNNKVAAVLRDLGYEIVTIRTEKSPAHSIRMSGADNLLLEEHRLVTNEFETALVETTVLSVLLARVERGRPKKDRVEYVMEEVARQSRRDGPLFVAAHIMAPHHPFVHDREGNKPNLGSGFGRADNFLVDVDGYGNQIYYLNKLLTEMTRSILENSTVPPIIIIQGDHGARLTWNWSANRGKPGQEQLNNSCAREVFANLNAIYLPGADLSDERFDALSPANTFRLVFDHQFNGELGLLDDESFFTTINSDRTVSIINITGQQAGCNSEWQDKFDALD